MLIYCSLCGTSCLNLIYSVVLYHEIVAVVIRMPYIFTGSRRHSSWFLVHYVDRTVQMKWHCANFDYSCIPLLFTVRRTFWQLFLDTWKQPCIVYHISCTGNGSTVCHDVLSFRSQCWSLIDRVMSCKAIWKEVDILQSLHGCFTYTCRLWRNHSHFPAVVWLGMC